MGSCEEEGGEGDEDDLGPHLDPPGRQLSTSFNTQSRCQVGVGHPKLVHLTKEFKINRNRFFLKVCLSELLNMCKEI